MSTLPADHSEDVWDVLVVGAGPAGSLAALELARRGCRVLLIDKAVFPRWKVCGCCLNGSALASLAASGLGGLPARLGAVPIRRLAIAAGGNRASLPLSEGVVLSRSALDAALVQAARDQGVVFQDRTNALTSEYVGPYRQVTIRCDDRETKARARVVLAADGLGGRLIGTRTDSLRRPSGIAFASRIGAGVVADQAPSAYGPGAIYMACGSRGYVGLVRLEDGRLDLAAAFDPSAIRTSGSLGAAAAQTLAEAGWPAVPGCEHLAWRGTPLLTRGPPRRWAERAFVLGDAAGYVEPFTGEGIAWALASARAVVPLAMDAVRRWDPRLGRAWEARYRQVVGRRQWLCRGAARVLRHSNYCQVLVAILARFPRLATPFVSFVNRRPR